ncbi:capsule assembly Wzi family protein [Albibacterium sp.]|uniref:capsule assembly Wzi family protein n=1 Tax=Albibacterium sp. TaxID=2952885 RepID=UPI002C3CC66D|nr:capsule assembly Wzi family protein [Albibacterium sp.]HUH18892.1 capsule assembly Wzi family protein [Albibacterium sp.]
MIRSLFTVLVITLCFHLHTFAQDSLFHYEVEAQTSATSNGVVPFWMRSNQFGSIPTAGVSGSLLARASKTYDTTRSDNWYGKEKLIDWGAGFEGRTNLGKESNLSLIEGYGKMRVAIFQLKAGRTKDVMGLNGDSSLTSGNFAVSSNALGIPKVEISIPQYYTLPIWDGLIAIKGNFSHGWAGKFTVPTKGLTNPDILGDHIIYPTTYFHQKSLYGRIGRDDWKLKLHGGFNHHAMWGSERDVYGDHFSLSNLQTFFYIVTGKVYGNNIIGQSKIGNQIGSIDVGIEYDFESTNLLIYRQNFYDVGALSKLANIRDGLNGIRLENKRFKYSNERSFQWKTILFEFLYTKNQAGELWSKYTKSGDEDYYNNYYYYEGWSYNEKGIGTPLITTQFEAKEGLVSNPGQYFINNRLYAFHIGFSGSVKDWNFISKTVYSRNFGTYGTSSIGGSQGEIRYPPVYGIFKTVNQFSGYLELQKEIKKEFTVGIVGAIDQGQLLDNSIGLQLRLIKRFK